MKRRFLNISKTRIIFIDLEFYVPECNRLKHGFSYNPYDGESILLGGSFYITKAVKEELEKSDVALQAKIQSIWLWNCTSEKELVGKFYQKLKSTLDFIQKADMAISPVLCGIGVQNSDVPILMALFERYNFLSKKDAFKFMNQFRVIDLSVLGIPFFNNSTYFLYPKQKNQLLNKFYKDCVFEDGRGVWDLYEQKQLALIEERTKDEILYTVKMYGKMKRGIDDLKLAEECYKKHQKIKNQEKTIEAEKLLKSLTEMPSDFYSEERVDEPPQEREDI
ncbi:hypothetical protein [Acinetobacter sp. P8-3-8]|uniref:hypothetical protein n=1 Tax=Acinetobacter sp. P8-3-8 TaxID=1029823 RepID=UPI0002485B40|nr:hypothetical protein [Acinetobacter sp. P8-3-8]